MAGGRGTAGTVGQGQRLQGAGQKTAAVLQADTVEVPAFTGKIVGVGIAVIDHGAPYIPGIGQG